MNSPEKMKTVQQHLLEVDIDELIYHYLLKSPPPFWEIKRAGVSVIDAFVSTKRALRKCIREFVSLPAAETKQGVFYARPSGDGVEVELVFCRELFEADPEHVENYSWEFTPWDEVAGYLVADTDFTTENLAETLAIILEGITFLGLSEDAHSRRLSKINERLLGAE